MATPSDATVTDFDQHSSEFAADPFGVLDNLLENSPRSWSTAHGGFWVVADHEHVIKGLADYETFSSSAGPAIPVNPFGARHIPVALDPPDHREYRRVLNDWYSKSSILKLEPVLREMVEGIVQGLVKRGSWDFAADLANVSPGNATLGILGWDASRQRELMDVMARTMDNQASKDPEVIEANSRANAWIRDQIIAEAQNRREHPTSDLMSVLANEPTVYGRPLTDEEITDMVVLLLLAGFHTTSGAFTSLMIEMEKDPEFRRRLQEQRELIPAAIEEVIRVYSPAAAHARLVMRDLEFGGINMRKGDMVLFINMAANRDPEAFSDPGTLDLDHPRARSVAFGWGVHRCLGLHLARLILKIEVETVFDLMPGYEIDMDNAVLTDHMGIGYVYRTVPAHLPAGA